MNNNKNLIILLLIIPLNKEIVFFSLIIMSEKPTSTVADQDWQVVENFMDKDSEPEPEPELVSKTRETEKCFGKKHSFRRLPSHVPKVRDQIDDILETSDFMNGLPKDNRRREIEKMKKKLRMKLFWEVFEYILSFTEFSIFGGCIRDKIRLDAGLEDKVAFTDIDVVVDINEVHPSELQEFVEAIGAYFGERNYLEAEVTDLPGRSSYAGKCLTIKGVTEYLDVEYQVDVDFVVRAIDEKLDLSIGSLIQDEPGRVRIRTGDKYGLTLGKVMRQILSKEFDIIGLNKNQPLQKQEEFTQITYLYQLIHIFNMQKRITKMIDRGWRTDFSNHASCQTLHKATGPCIDCNQDPPFKAKKKDYGKWCIGVQCCQSSVPITEMYQIVSDTLTTEKGKIYPVPNAGLVICPQCENVVKF